MREVFLVSGSPIAGRVRYGIPEAINERMMNIPKCF